MRPLRPVFLMTVLIACIFILGGLFGCGDDNTVTPIPTQGSTTGTVSGSVFQSNGTTLIPGAYVALFITGLATADENPFAQMVAADGTYTFNNVPLNTEVTIEAWNSQDQFENGGAEIGSRTGNFTVSPFTVADIISTLYITNDYAGSNTCEACHKLEYDQWSQMGHKYKLVPVPEDGTAPEFPNISRVNEAATGTISPGHFPGYPSPPPGVASWNDLAYMFGNFIWGGRFITDQGFFLTDASGNTVSYDLEEGDAGWNNTPGDVNHSNTVKMSRYTCYSCHTVGMDGSTDNPFTGMNNDPKTTATGAFVEAGVGCEACHGPGLAHIQDPGNNPMTVLVESDKQQPDTVDNLAAKSCGDCHDDEGYGVVQGGFVFANHARGPKHLALGPHEGMDCQNCHNPHASTAYGLGGVEGFTEHAVSNGCETCHSEVVVNHNGTNADGTKVGCVECHMPVNGYHNTYQNQYHGDARALHIFKINPDASIKSTNYTDGLWDDNGTAGTNRHAFNKDLNGKSLGITLDYVCFQCHKNADNGDVGGPYTHYTDTVPVTPKVAFPLTEAQVQTEVNSIHTP